MVPIILGSRADLDHGQAIAVALSPSASRARSASPRPTRPRNS
ncbi:MAG: hypothetical protein R3F43_12480 [bacterium]